MPGKKILMLVGEFTEEYEIFVFEQAMHAVGHTVHAVCPDKKAGDVIATSLHDFEGHQTYTEKPGHNFALNKTFADARPKDYDAVYLRRGGRGPEYIRTDKRVQAIVRHFHEQKKPIFTICHGVQILVGVVDGVVRGKEGRRAGRLRTGGRLGGRCTYVRDLKPTEAFGRRHDGVMAKGWDRSCGFHPAQCLKVLQAPKSGTAREGWRGSRLTAVGRRRITTRGSRHDLRASRLSLPSEPDAGSIEAV